MSNCWLYLDCEILTGESFKNCPNRESCEHNARHTQNRWCFLPYQYKIPELDTLFEIPTLIVDHWVESSAREYGYKSAVELFYYYENNCLNIGKTDCKTSVFINRTAKNLGFAEAESIPYTYTQHKEYSVLIVEINSDFFQDLGWYVAVPLPYFIYHDLDIGKYLEVKFNADDEFHYGQAIELGWHPPCRWDYQRAKMRKLEVERQANEDFDPDEIPF